MARKRKAPVLLDDFYEMTVDGIPNMLVPWFLMASYLYYHHDISIISDGLFDRICVELMEHWEEVEHRHKHLIDPGDLMAGTGFAIPEDKYPGLCKGGAWSLVEMARS